MSYYGCCRSFWNIICIYDYLTSIVVIHSMLDHLFNTLIKAMYYNLKTVFLEKGTFFLDSFDTSLVRCFNFLLPKN